MLLNHKQCTEFDPMLFSYNYFPTQIFMNQNERPVAYYSMPVISGDYTPASAQERMFKWLNFLGQGTELGVFLNNWVQDIWFKRIIPQVKSFSSFILLIEGPLPEFGIRKHRLMLHNHLPRHGKNYHNTITCITPLCLEKPVVQYFNYADYYTAGISVPSEEQAFKEGNTFAERIQNLTHSYVTDATAHSDLTWNKILFPQENETLEIKFNAARYVHSVEQHHKNIFAAATFNDVEFINPQQSEINYEYYNTIV